MSQQRKLIYVPLVVTVLLCLLAGVYLAASKRSSKSTPSNKITKHKVETPADETLKYWTEDRMRNAKAAPMPTVNVPERKKRQTRRPPRPTPPQDA